MHIWNELTQSAGHQLGYANMVGNTPTLTTPKSKGKSKSKNSAKMAKKVTPEPTLTTSGSPAPHAPFSLPLAHTPDLLRVTPARRVTRSRKSMAFGGDAASLMLTPARRVQVETRRTREPPTAERVAMRVPALPESTLMESTPALRAPSRVLPAIQMTLTPRSKTPISAAASTKSKGKTKSKSKKVAPPMITALTPALRVRPAHPRAKSLGGAHLGVTVPKSPALRVAKRARRSDASCLRPTPAITATIQSRRSRRTTAMHMDPNRPSPYVGLAERVATYNRTGACRVEDANKVKTPGVKRKATQVPRGKSVPFNLSTAVRAARRQSVAVATSATTPRILGESQRVNRLRNMGVKHGAVTKKVGGGVRPSVAFGGSTRDAGSRMDLSRVPTYAKRTDKHAHFGQTGAPLNLR